MRELNLRSTIVLAGLALGLVGSQVSCERQGFECGTPVDLENEIIQRCTRPDEICICATHSCAVAVPSSVAQGEEGDSRYRYVASPFAAPNLAGEWVAAEDAPEPGMETDGSQCASAVGGADTGTAGDTDAGGSSTTATSTSSAAEESTTADHSTTTGASAGTGTGTDTSGGSDSESSSRGAGGNQ